MRKLLIGLLAGTCGLAGYSVLRAFEDYGTDYNDTWFRRPDIRIDGGSSSSDDDIGSGSAMGSVGVKTVQGGIVFVADPDESEDGKGNVESVSFANDSKHFVTAQSDNEIRLWRIESLEKVGNVKTVRHKGGLFFVTHSPDGQFLASVSGSSIRVWQAANLKSVSSVGGKYISAAFTANSRSVIAGQPGDSGSTFSFWSIENGKQERSFNSANISPGIIGMSADGRYIVHSSPADSTAVFLSDPGGSVMRRLSGHSAGPLAYLSGRGQYIVSIANTSSGNNEIFFWSTGGARINAYRYRDQKVEAGAVSSDGNFLFTLTSSSPTASTLRIYSRRGGFLASRALEMEGRSLAVSPDNNYVVVVGPYQVRPGFFEGRIYVFDLKTIVR